MFTPKQVSEMLDLPPSTLRRYSVDYAQFLSEQATTQGKKRFYTDADILALRRLKQLVKDRKSPDDIAQAMQLVDETPDQPASTLALVPEILQEFENIRSIFAQIQTSQQAQAEETAAIRERLTALEEELQRERSRSWWDKLRGKG